MHYKNVGRLGSNEWLDIRRCQSIGRYNQYYIKLGPNEFVEFFLGQLFRKRFQEYRDMPGHLYIFASKYIIVMLL